MSSQTAILISRKSKLYIRHGIFLSKSKRQQQSDQLCDREGKDLPYAMHDLRMHLKIALTVAGGKNICECAALSYSDLVKGEKDMYRVFPTL